MPAIFYHADGRASPHPTSLESAKSHRKPRYDDGAKCPTCAVTSIKYTATGECIHCARMKAMHFYNLAALRVPIPADAQWRDAHLAACLDDFDEFIDRYPTSPAQAVEEKLPGWVRVEPCSKKGHVGLRTVDGHCYLCAKDKQVGTPRQRALLAGQAWYTPDEPCSRCGQQAERRVNNGECSGCVPRRRNKGDEGLTPAQILMRDQPDMLLGRDDARALGLPVYRTGTTCKRGHTGFRYTSTGACVDCVALLAGRKGVPS